MQLVLLFFALAHVLSLALLYFILPRFSLNSQNFTAFAQSPSLIFTNDIKKEIH